MLGPICGLAQSADWASQSADWDPICRLGPSLQTVQEERPSLQIGSPSADSCLQMGILAVFSFSDFQSADGAFLPDSADGDFATPDFQSADWDPICRLGRPVCRLDVPVCRLGPHLQNAPAQVCSRTCTTAATLRPSQPRRRPRCII